MSFSIELIILFIVVGIGVGGTLYFILSGKKDKLKWFLSAIAAAITSTVFAIIRTKSKFEEEAEEKIEESKSNDEKREETIDSIEDRIEKNKELLDEINKAIND